jgi:hypothetical protein
MRCNDFDAQIDEMLSGILHPDANQHMRQCERCTSHYRARAAVQSGLRQLALASEQGPSAATDRAVMDAYRNLQLGRPAAGQSQAAPQASARVLTFPGRASASPRVSPHNGSTRSSNHWWGGAAVAALVLAVLGSGLHVRNGITTVSAPAAANVTAPSAAQSVAASPASAPAGHEALTASVVSPRVSLRTGQPSATRYSTQSGQANAVQVDAASSEVASAGSGSSAPAVVAAKANPGSSSQAQTNTSPLIHLASSEATSSGSANGPANNAAQPPNSTWPGYSNLVYCDPVVCSGPMEVVHIKVPAGQGKPDAGESGGNGFVGADVVVGPDGVARAIRVAN